LDHWFFNITNVGGFLWWGNFEDEFNLNIYAHEIKLEHKLGFDDFPYTFIHISFHIFLIFFGNCRLTISNAMEDHCVAKCGCKTSK